MVQQAEAGKERTPPLGAISAGRPRLAALFPAPCPAASLPLGEHTLTCACAHMSTHAGIEACLPRPGDLPFWGSSSPTSPVGTGSPSGLWWPIIPFLLSSQDPRPCVFTGQGGGLCCGPGNPTLWRMELRRAWGWAWATQDLRSLELAQPGTVSSEEPGQGPMCRRGQRVLSGAGAGTLTLPGFWASSPGFPCMPACGHHGLPE